MSDLINIIKEEYRELGTGLEIKRKTLTSVKLKLEGNRVFYYIKNYDGEALFTNAISILPDQENKEIFKKIVKTNERIAKRIGVNQIKSEASTELDRAWLKNLGYNFEDRGYWGIKKLK